MKKQLTVALGLAVIATPVFASKARLEALGEDNFGSYYINDNRNQFLNPARINEAKDLVTYEFGSSSDDSAVTADAPNTPKAEGGFNKSWNNMVWGLHFGNSTPLAATVRGLDGLSLQERQPWDFFIGGDTGMKWGANVTLENYDGGSATNANRLSSNSLRTRLGIISGDLEAFAHISLKNDAKDFTGNSVEGKSSYFLGAGYMLNSYKLFADYKHVGTDYEVGGVGSKDWTTNVINVGAARQERLNDKANVFAKLNLTRSMIEDDGLDTFNTVAGEVTSYILPINVGLEYDAASWLALRASVGQNLWSNQKSDPKGGSKSSVHVADTAVRAGATLKFGELAVDGLISTNSNGDAAAAPSTDASTDAGAGSLRTDSLMTRVSMTYRF